MIQTRDTLREYLPPAPSLLLALTLDKVFLLIPSQYWGEGAKTGSFLLFPILMMANLPSLGFFGFILNCKELQYFPTSMQEAISRLFPVILLNAIMKLILCLYRTKSQVDTKHGSTWTSGGVKPGGWSSRAASAPEPTARVRSPRTTRTCLQLKNT